MNEPSRLPPLPRWFLLLPILAAAVWWPIDPYWQSDDFLALHYARDFGNVLHDFVGPQYGAADVWLFYRPLITASFWFDLQLGGTEPMVSHVSNVLAHGVSALLVALIWRRFLPDRAAWCAGLLWAVMPSHIGSLAWAVGRVDSHTTMWCLLAIWLFLRQCARVQDGERPHRWPALLAFAAALASKELAFVLPALMTMLAWFVHQGPGRLRFVLRESAPAWLLFGGYLVFRWLVLGRFGGYLGAAYEPMPMLTGLLTYVRNLAVPIAYAGQALVAKLGVGPTLAIVVACVPLVPAVIHWGVRPLRLFGAVLLFGIAAAPLAAFLADGDYPHNLRYFYFPSIVLAGLLAAPGRVATVLVLIAWAAPFVAVRSAQLEADHESAAMHRALLREAADGATSPMFVAGMPHSHRSGTAVQLHFGIDRMLEPPFGPGSAELFALRPLVQGGFTPWPEGEPFALPRGSTWFFADSTALGKAPPPPPLPELPIAGDDDGVVDFSYERLLEMAGTGPPIALTTHAGRPQCFQLTVFTSSGYLACRFLDHGPDGADHGTISVRKMMEGPGLLQALYGPAATFNFGEGMQVPATIDLVPEFPVLIEAGTVDQNYVFTPTHRARRLLTFRFDRRYAAWVRLVQGRG